MQLNIIMHSYSNHSLLLFRLFRAALLGATASAFKTMPTDYDPRSTTHSRCAAWRIMDQGDCLSCCAYAIASALSARECIRDNRDTMYSAQQIWDCAGPTIATCERGTNLYQMQEAMGSGDRAAYFLIPNQCTSQQQQQPQGQTWINTAPDPAKCAASFEACQTSSSSMVGFQPRMQSSTTFSVETFKGPSDYGLILAAKYMMQEIWTNGPVVSVLVLETLSDLIRFSNLGPNTIYYPGPSSNNNNITTTMMPAIPASKHCIMVYGWGSDKVSGARFWYVQNSFGNTWSNNGTGRIAIGTLERTWKAFSTDTRPCGSLVANFSDCLYPPMQAVMGQSLSTPPISTTTPSSLLIVHSRSSSSSSSSSSSNDRIATSTIICLTLISCAVVISLAVVVIRPQATTTTTTTTTGSSFPPHRQWQSGSSAGYYRAI